LIQILANAVIYAAEISIIAVGVALTYSILRFANFAHIQFAVIGGYVTYTFYALLGLPLVVAAAMSAILTGGLAVLVDRIVYRRLRATSP
jgi:branched-subunit amino acid ABC-type transport system permease component